LGNYQVLDSMGVRSLGPTVRARHVIESRAQRQGGDVVIKLLQPVLSADRDLRRRFSRVPNQAIKLDHPSLVKVHDALSDGPWLGLVTAFVEGEDLSGHICPGGLELAEALKLLEPIAAALDYLHSSGLVHGCLKPENIRLRRDGTPVILDVGFTRDIGAGLSGTMISLGGSTWMAPEQADGDWGPAADRYALGMIAYALLAGRLPWRSSTGEGSVLAAKLDGRLLPLSETKSDLPDRVCVAVMTMLASRYVDRPSRCRPFIESLSEGAAHADPQIDVPDNIRRVIEMTARRMIEVYDGDTVPPPVQRFGELIAERRYSAVKREVIPLRDATVALYSEAGSRPPARVAHAFRTIDTILRNLD